MITTEFNLHKQITDYLKWQYKNIIFTTDMSGVWLPKKLANIHSKLRSNRGIPDILIFATNESYCGLFLEVKKESPFKKNGELKKNKHLQEQATLHQQLRMQGYAVYFVWNFEQAKKIIDNYLLNGQF